MVVVGSHRSGIALLSRGSVNPLPDCGAGGITELQIRVELGCNPSNGQHCKLYTKPSLLSNHCFAAPQKVLQCWTYIDDDVGQKV
jgi:hypothetical protein